MAFLNDGDFSPWYNQVGPAIPSGPSSPTGPTGGETPIGTGTGTTGPAQPTFPTCQSTIGQCPCSYGGCMNPQYMEYNANATCDDGSCSTLIVQGCTDPNSTNFNPNANVDDGSCIGIVSGCTDPNALNYNSAANTDDGSCIAIVSGCSDPNAANYNPQANVDCSGNVVSNSPVGQSQTAGSGTTTAPAGPSMGFSGYSNMGGCGNYNMASGCGYSNFNQRGFGGYEDKMWFND